MEYVGIDWASRRAAWCALDRAGGLLGEGQIPADLDGLMGLVARRGLEVSAAVEMMSGAVWVADTLRAGGWRVQVADARRAKALAPLAAKTDRIDARVLAELCRRELVPELWVASLDDRALRERLLRRMHLVRLRTSAKNRIFGLLSQWGLRVSVKRLRQGDPTGRPRSKLSRAAVRASGRSSEWWTRARPARRIFGPWSKPAATRKRCAHGADPRCSLVPMMAGFRFALTLGDGDPADPAVFTTIIPTWHVGDKFVAGDELRKFRIVAIARPLDEEDSAFDAIWIVEPVHYGSARNVEPGPPALRLGAAAAARAF